MLVDRFVENATEIDVDALCDGEDVYIAAVMQHVEEAGVHSGDSVVRAAGAVADARERPGDRARRRAGSRRRSAWCGLLNVQLAVADSTVYVLEANPRASRTVPVREQGDRRQPRRGRVQARGRARSSATSACRCRAPTEVSVKAAVLPFARFPGADPVLGPEMRSTGEVMASASDLPTALAKAERAAGRPLPTSGTAFLSVRDADKSGIAPIAAALAGLGFGLVATGGTATTLRAAGLDVEEIGKVAEARRRERRPSSTSSASVGATSSSTPRRDRAREPTGT